MYPPFNLFIYHICSSYTCDNSFLSLHNHLEKNLVNVEWGSIDSACVGFQGHGTLKQILWVNKSEKVKVG